MCVTFLLASYVTILLAFGQPCLVLAIQAALARQKRVLEATQRTREFLGNLILANAAAIKRHTVEIGDVYNSPVIAVQKIAQAHNDLVEAMDAVERLKQVGIDDARENITKLGELSAGLSDRVSELPEPARK